MWKKTAQDIGKRDALGISGTIISEMKDDKCMEYDECTVDIAFRFWSWKGGKTHPGTHPPSFFATKYVGQDVTGGGFGTTFIILEQS